MENRLQNPESPLQADFQHSSGEVRGKLKIFFGYAAGVGKTYAMLQAARSAAEQGVHVVAGCIEAQKYPQTAALAAGFPQLPASGELNIDAALQQRPQLLLVDDLAHINRRGSRHARRYQDVEELLKAGIDVYTTVSVQNIESLMDTVATITGVTLRERIPDSVFDGADQVELADIEPADLIKRLTAEGETVAAALTLDKLSALREVALRRLADRVNLLAGSRVPYRTGEHILVCLSSSPSNAKIIRTAARMARAFRGGFTALFVETPDFPNMLAQDKERLRANMRLAQQLGAAIETVYGDDVPYQIAEFARLSGVTKIVIGRSTATRKTIFSKPSLSERLTANVPGLDIHIIPDSANDSRYQPPKKKTSVLLSLRDIGISILLLLAATLIGYAFFTLGFTESNIITVYILAVLLISVTTTNRLCSLFSSIVSVLVFNFFFTVPQFTFRAYDRGYPVTFFIMFVASLLTGSLAAKLKENAKSSARAAYRTKILLETNQLLQKGQDSEAVISATAGQLIKLLRKDIVIYLADKNGLSEPYVYRTDDSSSHALTSESEKAVAAWVLKNNKHAGAATDTFSDAKCLYLAVRVGDQVYGVVGISMEDGALDSFENSVLLSILGECALALENIRNAREKEEAAILAKNEQLRANLLRAISHDLRTPLTSISGNASNLLSNYQKLDDGMRTQIFTDIYDDSMWLINLVENLLAVTRIEEGRVSFNQSAELMDEVVTEALRHVNRRSHEHTIRVHSAEDFILAQIDAKLIVQVIINIVDNAIKYTPAGSLIELSTWLEGKTVFVSIADNGPGIPDEQKKRVFDMFYTGANKIADSRRSLGLGLSLCKSIITAHGGTITVADNKPVGTVFTFTLPAGEVELHE